MAYEQNLPPVEPTDRKQKGEGMSRLELFDRLLLFALIFVFGIALGVMLMR